jgi:calcineurin-like phosphoesterase family protein
MRVAVVSDIHGNRCAFEAVLADLRQAALDLVVHGGDCLPMGPTRPRSSIRFVLWVGPGSPGMSMRCFGLRVCRRKIQRSRQSSPWFKKRFLRLPTGRYVPPD